MKPVAVVTGASGYLGVALCDALNANNWAVNRWSRQYRQEPGKNWIHDAPPTQVSDPESLQDAQVVFHLAGLAHQHRSISPATYTRANVQYTESVATRAANAGVRVFVLISSVAAVTDQTHGVPVTPESDPDPKTPYGVSKLAAEHRLIAIADASPMDWIIVRPPLIYGANPKGNLAPLVRLSRSGWPLPFAGFVNQRSMVSLGNLVHLLTLCADPVFAGKNRILMPADACLSTTALVTEMRSAYGTPARLFKMPDKILAWLTKLPLTGRRLRVLRSSLQVEDPWLRNSLNWEPVYTTQDQMSAMVGKR